jgi:hypothetical protein
MSCSYLRFKFALKISNAIKSKVMSKKTKLLTMACVCLLSITSCHERHNGNKYGHAHNDKQKLESKSNSNFKSKSNMKSEKPHRISHTYEQTINGSIKEIMPLYCPVREMDWCENWSPKAVYSNSGLVEKDCIFITSHGETDIVWIVTDYDIEKGHVEMVYLVPEVLVTKLEIQLTPITEDMTKALITYSKSSLSEMGNKVLEEFTKKEYDIMMDSWEKAMNHYLKTREMLTGLPNF